MGRCSLAFAIVVGGLASLYACSGPDGSAQVGDDGGGEAGAAQQDGGASIPDGGAVHGGRVDSGTDFDGGSIGGGDAGPSLKVRWAHQCWQTQNGQQYQAINFDLTTSAPVPLEATLFFTTNCDGSKGTENFNDVGTTITSGSYQYWFIHHPNDTSTSAIWSIGNSSTGCVDYEHAPSCH